MYQRILVALDDSACAQRALAEAVRLARASGAVLMIVTIVDSGLLLSEPDAPEPTDTPSAMAMALLERTEQTLAAAGVKGSVTVLESGGENVSWVVLRAASSFDADLIAIGTHGRSGFRRLVLGSVAEAVVRCSPCPVLVMGDAFAAAQAARDAA